MDSNIKAMQVKSRKIDNFELRTVQITSSPEFKGLKFVQLSDLHFGPATKASVIAKAVEISCSLKPDAVFITGDFIQLSHIGLRFLIASKLGPRFVKWKEFKRCVRAGAKELAGILEMIDVPIIAIPGNHDHYEGIPTLKRQFPKNVTWLINQSTELVPGISVSSLDDTNRGKPDLAATLTSSEAIPAKFKFLLTHNPDFCLDYDLDNFKTFDLVLCGHTHGGQIKLPFFRAPVTRTKQKDYVDGLAKYGENWIYVSRGVGFGTIPIRTFCPAEIALFEFV